VRAPLTGSSAGSGALGGAGSVMRRESTSGGAGSAGRVAPVAVLRRSSAPTVTMFLGVIRAASRTAAGPHATGSSGVLR
jgi:hypothetical protein